jgi:hypothetical protein
MTMEDAERHHDDEALGILVENFADMLSPKGLHEAVIMLLCRVAFVAEGSANPGERAGLGATVIRKLADGACEIYPSAEWPQAKP